MNSSQTGKPSKAQAAAAREERLAKTLRDNLAKRKSQGRARGTGKATTQKTTK